MNVKLKRQNQAFHYLASTSDNLEVNIDGSTVIGGEGKGARPMELMLMGIGGCVSIDLGLILAKQKQTLTDYSIEIEGVRDEDAAKAFNAVSLIFHLYGELEKSKVERALDLAINKYCSALKSIKESIEVSYSYTIHS